MAFVRSEGGDHSYSVSADVAPLEHILEPTWGGPPPDLSPLETAQFYAVTLHEVAAVLPDLGLPAGFPIIYDQLTDRLIDGAVASQHGRVRAESLRFDYPDQVLVTIGHFIDYYLRSWRHYVLFRHGQTNQPAHSLSWQAANDPALARQPLALQFQAGKDAHIVVDLPQALHDLKFGPQMRPDYNKIQNYIGNHITESLPDVLRAHPAAQWLIGHLEAKTIAAQRQQAWRNAGRLDQPDAKHFINHLDRQTAQQIARFQRCGSVILDLAGLTTLLPGSQPLSTWSA